MSRLGMNHVSSFGTLVKGTRGWFIAGVAEIERHRPPRAGVRHMGIAGMGQG